MRPLFVGGTGRSGTTILAKVIGAHAAFHTFPMELRFHTDPDGLVSLRDALVEHWSPFHADMALHRFRQLMRSLKRPNLGRYPTTHLAQAFGRQNYDRAVQNYIRSIEEFSFTGGWAGRTTLAEKALLRIAPGLKRRRTSLVRLIHYAGPLREDAFFSRTRAFIAELVGPILAATGKQRFVEHTPGNAIHSDFLLALFPEAQIVHVERDPRDVIASMRGRDWGPESVAQAARIVADACNHWGKMRHRLPMDRVLEVRFEDLVTNTSAVLSQICHFLGVEVSAPMLAVDLSHHHIGRWKNDLSLTEQQIVESAFATPDQSHERRST